MNCVYASRLWYGRRTLLICVKACGQAGLYICVAASGTCRRFRRSRIPTSRTTPPKPPHDGIRYIPLTQGKFAIVDTADFDTLNRYTWCASSSGRRPYACRSSKGRHIFMHRQIMQPPEGLVVDHIDGNRLNNRRRNLRVCTRHQNLYNSRPFGGASRFKGVWRDGNTGRWAGMITYHRKRMHLGLFDEEADAARAYDRKAMELFGEFAWLNFPKETHNQEQREKRTDRDDPTRERAV